MSARRKELGDFNSAGEAHKQSGKKSATVLVAQAEGESRHTEDSEMFEIVR